MAATTLAAAAQRPAYDEEVVRLFTVATIVRAIVGFSAGFFIAFQLACPAARRASSATCRRRGSRHGRKPRAASIRRERWIENRPAGVGTRETFGHREGDLLIVGKEAGKADVTSLVERDSRFTFLLANEDKRSTAAVDPADRYCNENCKSCCFGPLSPIRPPRSRLRSSGAAGWSRARLPR